MILLQPDKRMQSAITIIELLLVIVIIAVLAGLLLPAMMRGGHGGIPRTRTEMQSLSAAISQYKATYGHLPLVDSNANEDITFGIDSTEIKGFQKVSGTRLVSSNSELMIILLDVDYGVNLGHKMNPLKLRFSEARMVPDTKSHGVSIVDYQFRDPWGNPYIISLDADQDRHVRDACYASSIVSSNRTVGALTNRGGIYQLAGKVMIWSRGPDGKVSMAAPSNRGVNKDNALGWER